MHFLRQPALLPANAHWTSSVSTAWFGGCQVLVLYSQATVDRRCTGKTRRWQAAIVIVVALSLFAAVSTGWAARGSGLASAAMPPHLVWSQVDPQGAVSADHLQRAESWLATNQSDRSYLSASSPMPQKSIQNTWMTRDQPQGADRRSLQLAGPSGPAALAAWAAAPDFAARGAPICTPAAALGHQDLLTQLCIARR